MCSLPPALAPIGSNGRPATGSRHDRVPFSHLRGPPGASGGTGRLAGERPSRPSGASETAPNHFPPPPDGPGGPTVSLEERDFSNLRRSVSDRHSLVPCRGLLKTTCHHPRMDPEWTGRPQAEFGETRFSSQFMPFRGPPSLLNWPWRGSGTSQSAQNHFPPPQDGPGDRTRSLPKRDFQVNFCLSEGPRAS